MPLDPQALEPPPAVEGLGPDVVVADTAPGPQQQVAHAAFEVAEVAAEVAPRARWELDAPQPLHDADLALELVDESTGCLHARIQTYPLE